MPLWDTVLSAVGKYGPGLVESFTKSTGGGSPMYPGGPSMFTGGVPRIGAGTLATGGRRRKGRGLSASDIRGAQKVARLVQHFGYKPKIKARRRGRR